jgi:hypothetical protein
MVDKAVASTFSFLDNFGKSLTAICVLVAAIGWVYTLSGRVTDDHSAISAMQALDLPSEILKLQDEQSNANATAASQYQSLETQIQAVATQNDAIKTELEKVEQNQNTNSTQMEFMLKKYWGSVGP